MNILLSILIVLFASPVFAQTVVAPNVNLLNDAVSDPNLTKYCYYNSTESGVYTIGQHMDCAARNEINGVNRRAIGFLNLSAGDQRYLAITASDDAGNESALSNELFIEMQAQPLEVPQNFRLEAVVPLQ